MDVIWKMVRNIHVSVDDDVYDRLVLAKDNLTWKEFMLSHQMVEDD